MGDSLNACPDCKGEVAHLIRDYDESIIECRGCKRVWEVEQLWNLVSRTPDSDVVEQMREVLRFYADPDNYHATEPGMMCCMAVDGGRRAKQVLAWSEDRVLRDIYEVLDRIDLADHQKLIAIGSLIRQRARSEDTDALIAELEALKPEHNASINASIIVHKHLGDNTLPDNWRLVGEKLVVERKLTEEECRSMSRVQLTIPDGARDNTDHGSASARDGEMRGPTSAPTAGESPAAPASLSIDEINRHFAMQREIHGVPEPKAQQQPDVVDRIATLWVRSLDCFSGTGVTLDDVNCADEAREFARSVIGVCSEISVMAEGRKPVPLNAGLEPEDVKSTAKSSPLPPIMGDASTRKDEGIRDANAGSNLSPSPTDEQPVELTNTDKAVREVAEEMQRQDRRQYPNASTMPNIEYYETRAREAIALVLPHIRCYLPRSERESGHQPLEFRMDEDGELDEIVGTCDIHLERMSGNSWWLGVYRPGSEERAAITLHAKSQEIKPIISEPLPTEKRRRSPGDGRKE